MSNLRPSKLRPRIVIEPYCTKHRCGFHRQIERQYVRQKEGVWQCDECIKEARERFALMCPDFLSRSLSCKERWRRRRLSTIDSGVK